MRRRHSHGRAAARHKDLRMGTSYQHLSPDYLSAAVKRLDGVFGNELVRTACDAIAKRPTSLSLSELYEPSLFSLKSLRLV
jgi:hypothetical protein